MITDTVINVYSDESRHLAGQAHCMVMGSMWCESTAPKYISDKVRLLKAQHDISNHREIKWTKISKAKIDYYKDLVKLFFEDEQINFRAIVVPTKDLRHQDFGQTQDEFYYKMQYAMLSNIAKKHPATYRIFLDYKDTWSNIRTAKLAAFLSTNHSYDKRAFIAQPIRSTESTVMQLADLFVGAVSHANNEDDLKGAKGEIIELIEKYSGQKLNQQSPFGVDKFNIFMWEPR